MLKKVNRDALESLIIRVPVILFSFLHSIFIIRLLGPEGNGLYAFIMAGVSLSMVAAGFDAKRSTLYHLAKGHFDRAKIVGISVKTHFVSIVFVSIVIILLYFLKNKVSFLFIPEEHFSLFYVVFFIASFLFQHLTTLCQTILQSQRAFRTINKYLFLTNLLQVLLYGAGYLYVRNLNSSVSFTTGFALILAMQALAFFLAFYYTKRKYQSTIDFQTRSVRKPYLDYAKLGYVNQIGHFLNKRLDIWFVEIFTGLKNLGLYALASQLSNFLLLAAAPIEEVLKPYLITLERKEGNEVFIRYFKLILYFIIGIAALLFLTGPWIINQLFGSDFSSASTPLRILCLGIVFVNVKRVILNYNRAYNDLNYNIWAQWTGVLVTVVLDIILIPKFGIVGAAWASVFAYGTSALILLMIFMIRQKVNPLRMVIPTLEEIKLFRI